MVPPVSNLARLQVQLVQVLEGAPMTLSDPLRSLEPVLAWSKLEPVLGKGAQG